MWGCWGTLFPGGCGCGGMPRTPHRWSHEVVPLVAPTHVLRPRGYVVRPPTRPVCPVSLCHVRLAEAFAEKIHLDMRIKYWGYAKGEHLEAQDLHKVRVWGGAGGEVGGGRGETDARWHGEGTSCASLCCGQRGRWGGG